MEGFEYSGGSRMMAPGEWLAVMTDGVTESIDEKGEFFGGARVQLLLDEAPELQWPGEVVRRIREGVNTFSAGCEAADDVTMLVVRWNGVRE
jgi:serine phosphatase RsbU (regulator of sigma subunit)